MKKLRGLPTALAIAFVTACSDQPPRLTEPAVKSISGKEDVGQVLGTAQARLDRKDTPWNQMSDESLRVEIERAGGRVLIGLKSLKRARASTTPGGFYSQCQECGKPERASSRLERG